MFEDWVFAGRGVGVVLITAVVLCMPWYAVGTAIEVLSSQRRAKIFTVAPWPLMVRISLGLATSSLIAAAIINTTRDPQVALLSVLACYLFSVTVVVGHYWKSRSISRPSHRKNEAWKFIIKIQYGIPVIAMMGVLRWGNAFWTRAINDYPNYVASVRVWQHGLSEEAYRYDRPDAFGLLQYDRATTEKPLATAALFIAESFSGVSAASLLGPISLVAVGGVFSNTLRTLKELCPKRSSITTVMFACLAISTIPMSRVFDAQVGQTLALLALTSFITILAGSPSKRFHSRTVAPCIILIAFALGANFTLAIGSVGAICGAILLITSYREPSHEQNPDQLTPRTDESRRVSLTTRLSVGTILSLFLILISVTSLLNFSGYRRAIRIQTTGLAGINVPFPSPLGIFGLQTSAFEALSDGQNLVLWIAFGALVLTLSSRISGRKKVFLLLSFTIVVANLLYIVRQTDITNYATHKYLTVVMVVFVPIASATLHDARISVARKQNHLSLGAWSTTMVLLVSSLTLYDGKQVTNIVSSSVLNFSELEQLDPDTVVNLVAPNAVEAAVVSNEVPTRLVTTNGTYAVASPPLGNLMLVESSLFLAESDSVIRHVNPRYLLVERNFDVSNPEEPIWSTTNIKSNLYPQDSWSWRENFHCARLSARAYQNQLWLVFDLDPNLHSRYMLGLTSRSSEQIFDIKIFHDAEVVSHVENNSNAVISQELEHSTQPLRVSVSVTPVRGQGDICLTDLSFKTVGSIP